MRRSTLTTTIFLPVLAKASVPQAPPASILYVAIATISLSSPPTHAPASSLPDFFYLPGLASANPRREQRQPLPHLPQTPAAPPHKQLDPRLSNDPADVA